MALVITFSVLPQTHHTSTSKFNSRSYESSQRYLCAPVTNISTSRNDKYLYIQLNIAKWALSNSLPPHPNYLYSCTKALSRELQTRFVRRSQNSLQITAQAIPYTRQKHPRSPYVGTALNWDLGQGQQSIGQRVLQITERNHGEEKRTRRGSREGSLCLQRV